MNRIVSLLLLYVLSSFTVFSQGVKMQADEFFVVAKGVSYPERFQFRTVTTVSYPKANTYIDSGITVIDQGRIFVQSKSNTIISGSIGTLNLNHESKIALFSPSDSFTKEIVAKFPDIYEDKTDYSEIEPYLEKAQNTMYTKDQEEFIRNSCTIVRTKTGNRIEIAIQPKSKTTGYFISGKIVLDESGKLIETETSYREVYALDYNGNEKYRIVKQKYTDYKYNSVAAISASLYDFIEFKSWKLKLKKYTDYKLDML